MGSQHGVVARGGLWGLMQHGIMVLNVQHCAVQRANEESVSFSDSRPFLLGWSGFWCCLLRFVCSDALLWTLQLLLYICAPRRLPVASSLTFDG